MSKFKFRSTKSLYLRAARILSVALLCFSLLTSCSTGSGAQIFPSANDSGTKMTLSEDGIQSLPQVSAESAILIETSTASIVGMKNADRKMSMASTTKIMSALVAIEHGDIAKTVSVSPAAVGVEGSSIYLYKGEKLTLEELIYAMMLESANDAAAAIAIEVGGSIEGFASLMNEKAAELGLESTHFTNPHGLDNDDHYTTARDLATVALAAMKNETFKAIVSTYKKTIPLNETEGVRLLINHNKLLKGYDGAVGIKTGYTKKSGRCLVSAAEKDGVGFICVTLNAPDDWQDHARMLDFGFSIFESRLLCGDGEFSYTLPVVGGEKDYITVKNKGELCAVIKNGGEIIYKTELPRFAYAPVKEGDQVGRLVYITDGKEIASSPLYASYSSDRIIYKKSLTDRIISLFSK